jgi:hypothetical protein
MLDHNINILQQVTCRSVAAPSDDVGVFSFNDCGA